MIQVTNSIQFNLDRYLDVLRSKIDQGHRRCLRSLNALTSLFFFQDWDMTLYWQANLQSKINSMHHIRQISYTKILEKNPNFKSEGISKMGFNVRRLLLSIQL